MWPWHCCCYFVVVIKFVVVDFFVFIYVFAVAVLVVAVFLLSNLLSVVAAFVVIVIIVAVIVIVIIVIVVVIFYFVIAIVAIIVVLFYAQGPMILHLDVFSFCPVAQCIRFSVRFILVSTILVTSLPGHTNVLVQGFFLFCRITIRRNLTFSPVFINNIVYLRCHTLAAPHFRLFYWLLVSKFCLQFTVRGLN